MGVLAPTDWLDFHQEAKATRDLIERIADTPATSRPDLRAKALALRLLLDGGDGRLYEDAAAPDVLAWSLVQDILDS